MEPEQFIVHQEDDQSAGGIDEDILEESLDPGYLNIRLEDILMPLSYMIEYKKRTIDMLWKDYDVNKNYLLGPEELQPIFEELL